MSVASVGLGMPDLPAPKVTLTRYPPKKATCVQVKNGVRKVVQCPSAKKPASAAPARMVTAQAAGAAMPPPTPSTAE